MACHLLSLRGTFLVLPWCYHLQQAPWGLFISCTYVVRIFCTRRKLSVQLPFLICFGQFFGRYLWFQKLRWPILISHRMQLYFSFKLLYCNHYYYYSWCTYVCGRIHKKLFFHLQISFFAPNGKLILPSQ